MTIEEMAQRILQTVDDYAPASLVEIVRACGDEAKGDCTLTLGSKPNAVLWDGVSDKFTAAFNLIKPKTTITTASWLIYAMDGGVLDLPVVADEAENLDFETETWCPGEQ
jgi:hypothetical protein